MTKQPVTNNKSQEVASSSDISSALTGGKLLFRNTFWNLLGQVLPLLVAVISIPFLITYLGTDRFGILTLAWVIIGYFSLFDFGIGRALTKMVAEELGAGNERRLPPLVWTALALMLSFGILGMVVLLLSSHWLTYNVLKIPVQLRSETEQSLMLLAASLPIVIVSTGLRGILEAKQCFSLSNAIRIPMGILMYAGPLLVLPFYKQLQPIIVILLFIRIISLFVYFRFCLHVLPCLRNNLMFKKEYVKLLFCLGGWMTVSNIISPLMVYGDRFMISAVLSVSAVAYYTTPYEVVTKFLIIPGALIGVLFPAFSSSLASDPGRALMLYKRSLKYVYVVFFVITMTVLTFSREGLTLWLGAEFARNSTNILRWLAVGVFVNSFSQISYTFIQGAGRPDFTAKLHLIELPLYLVAVWGLMKMYGLEGAAMAWVLRIVVDAVLLFYIAQQLIAKNEIKYIPYALIVSSSLIAFSLICFLPNFLVKVVLLVIGLLLFSSAIWFVFLSSDEKLFFRGCIQRRYCQL